MVNFSRSSSKSQVRAVRKSGLFKAKHFLLHRALTETWSLEDITVPTAFSNCGDLFLQGLDMGQDPPYCHFQTISLFTPLKQIQFFFWNVQHFRLCHLLSLFQWYAGLRFPSLPLPGRCWPLPHCLALHNSHLILGNVNIHRAHWSCDSLTYWLPMVLSFIWLQLPALRVIPWALWPVTASSLKLYY